jgi:hypothetical protein
MRLVSLINGIREGREERESRINKPLENACKRGAPILQGND